MTLILQIYNFIPKMGFLVDLNPFRGLWNICLPISNSSVYYAGGKIYKSRNRWHEVATHKRKYNFWYIIEKNFKTDLVAKIQEQNLRYICFILIILLHNCQEGFTIHLLYFIKIHSYIIQMGCETCKVGAQTQNQIFTSDGKTGRGDYRQSHGILNSSDKQIWISNLSQPNQPDDTFWATNQNSTHSCFTQIKKDTCRSFPSCGFFLNKNNLERFENLLKKFALYFPKVGYTQGLNFLAGYILIAGFDDNQAFKVLVRMAIHQKLLIIGLYEDRFPLNTLYCAVFWKLLEKRQPNTALKIKLAGVPDQIWIFQWFMTFFLYSFPVQFVKKFFDYIICKKQFAMVGLALGIINCLKTDINNLKDPDQFEFFEFFDNLKNIEFCQANINIQKVIIYANSITKHQITKALQEIKLSKNIYYTYFRKENQRPQIWRQINQKLTYERRMFLFDPRSSQYTRDKNSVQHLERLLLQKSRLYRSRTDSRFSSQIRTSNFTVDLDQGQQYMSQRLQQIPHNHTFGNPYFHEYGGIRQDYEARQLEAQKQRQKKTIQKSLSMKKSQNHLMRAPTRDDSSISKDSRNQIGRFQ